MMKLLLSKNVTAACCVPFCVSLWALPCILAVPAYAGFMEDAVPAIRTFGLLGTWAIDCSKPIGPDNPHVKYFIATQPETVVHTFANSQAGVNASDIIAYSETVADDRLVFVVRKTGVPTTMGIIKRVGDGIQVIDVLNSDGKHLIANAIVAATNKPSQVYLRCGD